MPVNIVVPSFGESITEGTVAQWLKKEGQFVKKDDILLEVESEKATQGIPSPASGTLHIAAKEGARVEVGSVIGHIDETATVPTTTTAPAKPAEPAKSDNEKPAPAAAPVVPSPKSEPLLSPAARRLATEEGVDASKIAGTGRHGVVLKENVQAHVKPP